MTNYRSIYQRQIVKINTNRHGTIPRSQKQIYPRSLDWFSSTLPRNQSRIGSSSSSFDFRRGTVPIPLKKEQERKRASERERERRRECFKRETERRSDRTRFHRLLGSRFHIFSRKSFRFASIEGIRGGILARSCESEALLSDGERKRGTRAQGGTQYPEILDSKSETIPARFQWCGPIIGEG